MVNGDVMNNVYELIEIGDSMGNNADEAGNTGE